MSVDKTYCAIHRIGIYANDKKKTKTKQNKNTHTRTHTKTQGSTQGPEVLSLLEKNFKTYRISIYSVKARFTSSSLQKDKSHIYETLVVK